MHELVTMVSGWLVNYLAHSAMTLTVMGAVAWLGGRMLRKAGPQAQHRMWVAALLTGAALPLLPAGALGSYFSHADVGTAGAIATVTYPMIAATPGHWALTPFLSWMLAGAYLATALFCAARLLLRWQRTRAMARRSVVLMLGVADRNLLEGAARRLGVAAPQLRWSAELRGPVVLGLRRPLLLVPENFFGSQTSEDIAAALAHECAHVARRDFGKNMLYECVAALVAYHPACWLMRRRIAETRELICDEMASRALGDRPEYAASLLRLATAMAGAAARPVYASGTQAIGVFDAGILEERIMRLTMDVPKVNGMWKMAMVAATTCALLGGAVTAMAVPFEVTQQDGAATSAPVHEMVYKIGGDVTPPVLTHSVDAKFPEKAGKETFKASWHGISVIGLIVNSEGVPESLLVKRSLSADFDQQAMDAVRQYRFKPAMKEGKPVAVSINIEVNFTRY